jgi:hypothetical protein
MAKTKAVEEKSEVVLITPEQVKVITETLERQLATRSITEQTIEKYEKDFMTLVVNGIDDKEGLQRVYDARQLTKRTRIATKEICEEWRAPKQAEVKVCIEKQKEITAKLVKIEEYLQEQEDKIQAEKDRVKEEARAAQIARLKDRVAKLTEYGVKFNGSEYELDGLQFSDVVIRESEDDHFHDKILPQFKELYDAKEAIAKAYREAQALKEKQQQEAQEEFERQQKILKDAQDALKKQQQDIEKKKIKEQEERTSDRIRSLYAMGMTYVYDSASYCLRNVSITHTRIMESTEEEWTSLMADMVPKIEEIKNQIAQEKADEQKKIEEYAVEKARLEAEETERLNTLKRQQEIEEGKESVKYAEMVKHLKNTPIYQFKSGRYITKARIIKDFIADLD